MRLIAQALVLAAVCLLAARAQETTAATTTIPTTTAFQTSITDKKCAGTELECLDAATSDGCVYFCQDNTLCTAYSYTSETTECCLYAEGECCTLTASDGTETTRSSTQCTETPDTSQSDTPVISISVTVGVVGFLLVVAIVLWFFHGKLFGRNAGSTEV